MAGDNGDLYFICGLPLADGTTVTFQDDQGHQLNCRWSSVAVSKSSAGATLHTFTRDEDVVVVSDFLSDRQKKEAAAQRAAQSG
jgi:hypothetical protein